MRQFSPSEIEHLTNYWIKTLGIKSIDLTTHPQIDDVILLIKFLKEFLEELKGNNRIGTYIIWDWVYKERKPLSKKYLKRLNRIGQSVLRNRHFKQQKINQQRKQIKSKHRTLPA